MLKHILGCNRPSQLHPCVSRGDIENYQYNKVLVLPAAKTVIQILDPFLFCELTSFALFLDVLLFTVYVNDLWYV